MISRALYRAEQTRTNILFAIAGAIGLYTYREVERRQKLQEGNETARRTYVDDELAALNRLAVEARAKAEGVAEAERVRKERAEAGWKPREHLLAIVGSLSAVAGVVVVIIAYHLLG